MTTYTAPIKDRIAAARQRGRSWSEIASLLEAITGGEYTADRLSAAASHWAKQGDPRFAAPKSPDAVLDALPVEVTLAPDPVEFVAPRPSFADYQPKMCQYPMWGEDVRFGERAFCGHRTEPGLPYCKRHAARCYVRKPAAESQNVDAQS